MTGLPADPPPGPPPAGGAGRAAAVCPGPPGDRGRGAAHVQGLVEREPLPAAARRGRGDRPRRRRGQPLPGQSRRGLVDALAEQLGVPAGRTSRSAPGRSACCQQLVQAVAGPGDEVRLRVALVRGVPDHVAVTGARRPSRCRCAPTRRHDLDAMAAAITDAHPGGLRLHPEQPHRPGRHPGRARRVPRRGARATCWSSSTRPTSSSSATRTCRRRPRRLPRPSERRACCAPSPRRTAWPACASATRSPHRAGRRTRCARPAVPFGVSTVAQAAAHRLARAPRTSCSSGSTRWSPSATGSPTALRAPGLDVPPSAGQLRLAAGSATAPGSSPRRAPAGRRRCGRTAARACASPRPSRRPTTGCSPSPRRSGRRRAGRPGRREAQIGASGRSPRTTSTTPATVTAPPTTTAVVSGSSRNSEPSRTATTGLT